MHPNSFSFRSALVRLGATAFILMLVALSTANPLRAQSFGSLDRERGQEMLSAIKDELKKNYYDPNFHGMNLDARFKQADDRIKQSTSFSEMFGLIAQVLIELNDSHTFFLPPGRSSRIDYGWVMQMIGDKCYVVGVRPGSDAAAKGLQPGDEIYSLDGFGPSRDNLWKIQYSYNALRPRAAVRLVVFKPDGQLHLGIRHHRLGLKNHIKPESESIWFVLVRVTSWIVPFVHKNKNDPRIHTN